MGGWYRLVTDYLYIFSVKHKRRLERYAQVLGCAFNAMISYHCLTTALNTFSMGFYSFKWNVSPALWHFDTNNLLHQYFGSEIIVVDHKRSSCGLLRVIGCQVTWQAKRQDTTASLPTMNLLINEITLNEIPLMWRLYLWSGKNALDCSYSFNCA